MPPQLPKRRHRAKNTMAQQQVDISAMSLEQLNTYKGQFENEIKQLPVWKSTSATGARR